MTQNHNLSTPPEGFVDWDDPLNDNFRAIDNKLPIVDIDSNKGMYTPVKDAVFIAYDTGDVYRGDGSSFNLIDVTAGSPDLGDDDPITFGADDDYSIEYDSTNDYLQIRDELGSVDVMRFLSSGDVSIPSRNLQMGGNTVTQVGGTTDASAGAIRLANGTSINARNSGDTGDFGLTFTSSGTIQSGADIDLPTNAVTQGESNTETIAETTSPTGFTFSGSTLRDYIDTIDVSLTNTAGSQVTEDVTVNVYDGSDATGDHKYENTNSVTIGASSSATESFSLLQLPIDTGTYYVEVTTSGTDFTVDQTDVNVSGGVWDISEDDSGKLTFIDQDGNVAAEASAFGSGTAMFAATETFYVNKIRFSPNFPDFEQNSIYLENGNIYLEEHGANDWPSFEFNHWFGSEGNRTDGGDGTLIGNFRGHTFDTSGSKAKVATLQFSQDGAAGSNGVGGKIRLRPNDETQTEKDALVARKDWSVEIPNGEIHLSDALNLDPIAEPASPSSGYRLFVDSADGSLKAKDSAGTVTTIVS